MDEDLLNPISNIIALADALLKDKVNPLSADCAESAVKIYNNALRWHEFMLEHAQQEYLRYASHEIRMPLSSILGHSDIMLRHLGVLEGKLLTEAQREMIQTIHDQAQLLRDKVNTTIFRFDE